MLSEKEMKQSVKDEASREPDKFFPTEKMREIGLQRKQCPKCQTWYWTADPEREVCGEPVCEGGYSFIGRKACEHKMDFIGVWQRFSDLFEKRGYTPINRYPTISRWNPTSEFTLASITDFQPYVVRGEVKPPANPLVVPQTCMRFNDVDNVGITGRHNTGFIMIGQHAFETKETFDQPKYFEDIHAWLVEGMGIPLKDIVYHEDAWAGGGNFGCSLEFFAGGLEIGNQVYTMYERVGDDLKPLDIKVLDMGMGQERPAWFSHGTPTSYEPNFPPVMEKLFKIAGISQNGEEKEMMAKFLPYSGLLNLEEVDDIEKVWTEIAGKIDVDVPDLKNAVMATAGLYSVADHTRGLLFALTDGGLPSNSGGGYNLRLIYRRAMEYINRYGWDIDMAEVCQWHAEYLKPQFPEMQNAIPEIRDILENERKKFIQTKEMAIATVGRMKEKGKPVSVNDLIKLYDSKGIMPDLLVDAGLDVKVPADFYARVAELHEGSEAKAKTEKEERLEIPDLEETITLYFDNYLDLNFESQVLAIIDNNVILKETAFYPTSGGQLHDIGGLSGPTEVQVLDTFKQDGIILHKVEGDISGWKVGDTVSGHVDEARRRQLAQHHTVTHIINGIAKNVLGNHIWQAGAEKTEEKGRLDITHYDSLSPEQLEKIEAGSNQVIKDSIPVESMILPKDEAEKKFGFRLYQGGAIPGDELRVLRIKNIDTEACGGTHLNNTSEAIRIIILGTKKIQDGIIRIEYVAGKRADQIYNEDTEHLSRAMAVLGKTEANGIEQACSDIFSLWKSLRKSNGKLKNMPDDIRAERKIEILAAVKADQAFQYLQKFRELDCPATMDEIQSANIQISRPHEFLQRSAGAFKVQKEHMGKTLIRFLNDIDNWLQLIEA
ncbi:MAG: alanine--tRNA ligase [Thermoplasmata archaeon]|nr:alanine--tRNA ligase [Thermoplasmata archaeon]